jgi:hypothetical protein
MGLYCGIDLHSSNCQVVVLDQSLATVAERRHRNDLGEIAAFLEPHREELVGIAVESTRNWYWLSCGVGGTSPSESSRSLGTFPPFSAMRASTASANASRHGAVRSFARGQRETALLTVPSRGAKILRKLVEEESPCDPPPWSSP